MVNASDPSGYKTSVRRQTHEDPLLPEMMQEWVSTHRPLVGRRAFAGGGEPETFQIKIELSAFDSLANDGGEFGPGIINKQREIPDQLFHSDFLGNHQFRRNTAA